MYLTRLRLNPHNIQARRDLADAYDMHRTLVRAFVEDETLPPPRFLWRLEAQGIRNDPIVLVQSAEPGDWGCLEKIDSYLKCPAESKQIALGRLLELNARYRFRLLANPTVTRDGKRHGLVKEDEQLSWLARQGKRLGFHVEAAVVTANDVLNSRKGSKHLVLRRVCYEGRLLACDTEALASALQDGIGPGKAFGCGLLSLGRE